MKSIRRSGFASGGPEAEADPIAKIVREVTDDGADHSDDDDVEPFRPSVPPKLQLASLSFTTLPPCVRRTASPISSSSTGFPLSASQKALRKLNRLRE